MNSADCIALPVRKSSGQIDGEQANTISNRLRQKTRSPAYMCFANGFLRSLARPFDKEASKRREGV
jgi:hypothetical protein